MITFRYLIKPTRDQLETLNRHIETCRQLYNRLLGELNRGHDEGRVLSKNTAQAFLPTWKVGDFPKLNYVYSKVAQMVVHQLYANIASLAAKKRQGLKVGKLRYKGQGLYASLNYNQSGFKIDQGRGTIWFAKVGMVKTTFHRELPPGLTVKGIVVKRTRAGKWFACLQCDQISNTGDPTEPDLIALVAATLATGGRAIGIDLGITHFAADFDGRFAASPMHLDRSLFKVKMLQRNLSRKQKGSMRHAKAKHILAKLYEKVTNQRWDFLHIISFSAFPYC